MSSKICQNATLTSSWGWVGTLARRFLVAVHQAALPQRLREHHLDRADEAGCAVGDHQQRRPQATGDQFAEEAGPGVVALVGAGCQPSSTALP